LTLNLKAPPRDIRDAEDPSLIGRELISQGCDWPNDNVWCIYTGQTAKTFGSFTVDSFVDRIEGCFGLQSILRTSFVRRTPHNQSLHWGDRGEAREITKKMFPKDLTPP